MHHTIVPNNGLTYALHAPSAAPARISLNVSVASHLEISSYLTVAPSHASQAKMPKCIVSMLVT